MDLGRKATEGLEGGIVERGDDHIVRTVICAQNVCELSFIRNHRRRGLLDVEVDEQVRELVEHFTQCGYPERGVFAVASTKRVVGARRAVQRLVARHPPVRVVEEAELGELDCRDRS